LDCKYFGQCGSCSLYENGYEGQFNEKFSKISQNFSKIYSGEIEIFKSPESHYRSRAEFRIWHNKNGLNYAMRGVEKRDVVLVENCPMVIKSIDEVMQPLLKTLNSFEEFSKKLFSIEFLSSRSGELVITLIYHKKLSAEWKELANEHLSKFGNIIGRSRKEKIELGLNFVNENLRVSGRNFSFKNLENSFSQPNPNVNEKMVSWIVENSKSEEERDLIELYCGSGNFTIPLSENFKKVLATEVSKSGIATAKENMERNGVSNIQFARISSEEFVQAIDKVREFNRLKEVDLESFSLNSIFVDPPRAGLDSETIKLVSRFENILYISCNPETLKRDLELLSETHRVGKMAVFDQFPYTHHLEMGAVLNQKS
jgi:tRNA (uracil-5-)-methyltransferase